MFTLSIALVVLGTEPTPKPPIQIDAASVQFVDAPPTMPKGTQWAVLEGDPKAAGMFTIRLKAPKAFVLPMHTHPSDERVTVLEGNISVSFAPGRTNARTFPAGSFYVNPPGVAHHVYSETGCVVQITGQGPWRVEPVTTSR
jgi:quercetin dioxygenase-like cupin family protein